MFGLFKKKVIEIYSPISGEILPLSASPDPAFGEGMMGEGLCIQPEGNTVYAPIDGEVDIFHTLHAFGCNNGTIEMIVHVGMNTVALHGEGFQAIAPLQSQVTAKTPLVSFDKEALLSKVETLITPVVIVDKPEKSTLEIVKSSGKVEVGELIMKVIL